MADKKITELVALTDALDTDVLPIVDIGGNETKKITKADLLKKSRVDVAVPSSPFAGCTYFDPATYILYVYTGTGWKSIQLI